MDTRELVEPEVEGFVELAESVKGLTPDGWVVSTLCLAQAVRRRTTLRLQQARESLRRVEVKMFLCYDSFQTQEVLQYNTYQF